MRPFKNLYLLAALLLLAPTSAFAIDGSISAEGTVGRLYSLSLLGDLGLSDSFYLVGGYGFIRPADSTSSDGSSAVAPVVSHVITLGADYSPSRHWVVSATLSGSPQARSDTLLNPRAPSLLEVTISTSSRSLSGLLAVAYDSAGDSKLEWSADVGLGGAAWALGREVKVGVKTRYTATDALYTLRPTAGLTLTGWSDHDFSLRGAYTFYSSDPLTTGRFTDDEIDQLKNAFATVGARLVRNVEALQASSTYALARFSQADALSGYTSAPVWVETRISYRWRFTKAMSIQLSLSYLRYVPTQGNAQILSARYGWKIGHGVRVWLAAAVQRDEPLDHPAQRTADDPRPSFSGLVTLGAEFAP